MSEKYVHQNGKATLFINKYKKAENQPDLKGSGTTLDGKEIQIDAWKGETANGETKLNLSFSEPYVKGEEKPTSPKKPKDDGLGF